MVGEKLLIICLEKKQVRQPAFVPRWLEAGLVIAARGADGEVRAVELRDCRFFIATLFQPQLSSSCERPHPIVEAFLRAGMDQAADTRASGLSSEP